MLDELLFTCYVIVALLIWLLLEVTGIMAEARKDIVDGTSREFLVITCWFPILAFSLFMLVIVGLGWLINRASKIVLIRR